MKAIWLDPDLGARRERHWHLVYGRESPIEPPGDLFTLCGYAAGPYNGPKMVWDEPPNGPNDGGTVCTACLLQLANFVPLFP